MIISRHSSVNGVPVAGVALAVFVSLLLLEGRAHAQAGDLVMTQVHENLLGSGQLFEARRADEIRVALPGAANKPTRVQPRNIRRSLATLDYGTTIVLNGKSVPAAQASSRSYQRSSSRKAAGGLAGALLGLLAGGWLGAAIEGNCGCDDPGLAGAMIGAPVGAVVGGILGARFF